jgi:hypothetical protein
MITITIAAMAPPPIPFFRATFPVGPGNEKRHKSRLSGKDNFLSILD